MCFKTMLIAGLVVGWLGCGVADDDYVPVSDDSGKAEQKKEETEQTETQAESCEDVKDQVQCDLRDDCVFHQPPCFMWCSADDPECCPGSCEAKQEEEVEEEPPPPPTPPACEDITDEQQCAAREDCLVEQLPCFMYCDATDPECCPISCTTKQPQTAPPACKDITDKQQCIDTVGCVYGEYLVACDPATEDCPPICHDASCEEITDMEVCDARADCQVESGPCWMVCPAGDPSCCLPDRCVDQ